MNNTANIFANLTLKIAPDIQTGMLWDMVLFFMLVCGLYFLSVFVLKGKLIRKEKKSIVLKKDIAPLISTLLFHQKRASRQQKEELLHAKVLVQELLKNPRNRSVISEILLDIQTDLTGSTRERLLKIYTDLGLHTFAIEKLNNWRWEIVCQGITELTEMRVDESYIYVRKFINDNRSIVRKQAQLATVVLKHEGINYFLDTSKHKISDWQQLKLIKTLHNLHDFDPPPFRLWLTSANKDVVLFSLRLIKSFKQDDALESLKKLVKHRDDTIKTETIECMREFRYKEAIPLFKTIFWNCHSTVKLVLLSAIADMGSTADIPFLKQVEQKTTDFVIKSKAIGTINALAPETILPSTAINESLEEAESTKYSEPDKKAEMPDDPVVADDKKSHDHFKESLRSDTFQKYNARIKKEELFNELLFDGNENDISVIAEEIPVENEYFVLGQDIYNDAKNTEDDPTDTSAKSVGNINVEYKSLDTPFYQKEDVYAESTNLISENELEEELLKFSTNSEIIDHTNNEDNDGDGAELNKEPHNIKYINYDEVWDNPGWSDLLEPNFEIEWPEEHTGLENYDLSKSSIDFKLEVFPASFEKKLKSRKQILKKYSSSDDSDVSYSSAFELVFFASDLDGKLRLLDDILHLGDERDINFLQTLKEHKSEPIRQCAERNMKLMAEQLNPYADTESYQPPVNENNPDLIPAFRLELEEYTKEQESIIIQATRRI